MSPESRIKTFKDLVAWQKAIEVTKLVYVITKKFPENEKFGLTNQLRRAVVSIPSNISEGFGRHSSADRVRFYEIARGSANEVETQLIIAIEIGYIKQETYDEVVALLSEVHALVRGLITKTRKM